MFSQKKREHLVLRLEAVVGRQVGPPAGWVTRPLLLEVQAPPVEGPAPRRLPSLSRLPGARTPSTPRDCWSGSRRLLRPRQSWDCRPGFIFSSVKPRDFTRSVVGPCGFSGLPRSL